jgi:hypothetical protein
MQELKVRVVAANACRESDEGRDDCALEFSIIRDHQRAGRRH